MPPTTLYNVALNNFSHTLRRAFFSALSCLPLAASCGQAAKSAGAAFPAPGAGALEFTATPLTLEFPFQKDILLFQAVASDGTERFEFHINAEDLIVLRDFGHCIRSAARTQHGFKLGVPSRLVLRWDKATTRLAIDGREADEFSLALVDRFSGARPASGAGGSTEFEVSEVSASHSGGISAAPADLAFVQSHPCPDLGEILKAPLQERFQGVSLHNFPDEKAKARIRGYIAQLPRPMAGCVGKIVFVPKSHNPNSAWKGLAMQEAKTMLLQEVSLGGHSTFFHEAAHLYDFCSAAKGTSKSMEWERRFMKGEVHGLRGQSVLDQMDGSSASEGLADFVGNAYDLYLQPGALGRDGFLKDAGNMKKLEFLFTEGFITDEVRARLTPSGGR